MPLLRDLLTPLELDLLRLVPLPVSFSEFLTAEFASRITVDRLLYSLFAQIPGAQVTPKEGDYSYVSAYTDYAGWLKWFVAHRRPAARRSRDPELARAMNEASMARSGHANMPQDLTVKEHVWAPWQTPPTGEAPRQRRPRSGSQPTPNPLEQPQAPPRARQRSRNPLGDVRPPGRIALRLGGNPLAQPSLPEAEPLRVGDLVVTLNGRVRRITAMRGRLAVLDGSITYDLADLIRQGD